MEWVKTTAKTLPEAIDLALDNLGVDEAEAEIVILEEPRQGLFGRMRGTARVEARVKPKAVRTKNERNRNRRSESGGGKNRNRNRNRNRSDKGSGRGGGDGRSNDRGGNQSKGQSGGGRRGSRNRNGGGKQGGRDDGVDQNQSGNGQGQDQGRGRRDQTGRGDRNQGDDRGRNERNEAGDQSRSGGGRNRDRGRGGSGRGGNGGADQSLSTAGAVAAGEVGRDRGQSQDRKPKEEIPVEDVAVNLREFLSGLTDAFGFDDEVAIENPDEDTLVGSVKGQHGLMVGPKGRTLDAIQELARISAQRDGTSRVRIRVDVGGYREQRSAALTDFAQKAADRAVDNGVEVALEPMSPADRKVIHDALNGDGRVETRSVGNEPRRKVLVVPVAGSAAGDEEE